jgi:hypothetical protein
MSDVLVFGLVLVAFGATVRSAQMAGALQKVLDQSGFGANENEYRCEGTSQAQPG